jgi:CheY-like chemotaxis protein
MQKILLVDDYPAVLESFARLLRDDGFLVEETVTGAGAIQKLRSNEFDLAVIDWRLPDMSGLDVAQAVRDAGVLTPWVLFSGFMDFEIARRAGQLGAVKAVSSPIDIKQIVNDALKTARSRANGWSWFPAPPLTADMTAPERWAALVLRVCDAEGDPSTVSAWAAAVGSCESTIYATCKVLRVSARDTRDFSRMLRALRRNSGSVVDLEADLAVADLRTWASLFQRSGLRGRSRESVISLDEYLHIQKFVPQSHSGLGALRAAIVPS